ncbi:MAG: hypothetical protein CMQ61_06715 [Gammaproteobacteria bacterium]|nr:hypothetical protein [Gammaproteobacteria bacterium]
MIAREGTLPAVVSLLLSGAALGVDAPLAALAGLTLCFAVLLAFRDDKRVTPSIPLALVSPVDGRVHGVGKRHDPWLNRDCTRVSLKMPSLGMGVIRSPTEGRVREFWVRGGMKKDGDPEHASSPTCYALWIQTDEGDDVVVAVYGRRFISRFKAEASPGERIGHGHRLGFIYFGTAVTLYAPHTSEVDEDLRSRRRILGGAAVLAYLNHDEVNDDASARRGLE